MHQPSSFPDTYAGFDTETLLAAYHQGPERIGYALSTLAAADLKARPIEHKWSIQEIVIHLADSEIMGAARIRQTLAQSGRDFAAYDEAVWAEQLAYQDGSSQSVEEAVALFTALRRTTSRLLRRATAQDWEKTGHHAEHGYVTLRQLLELYADHSERHLAQILERRRLLDKTLYMPLLLEKRLY